MHNYIEINSRPISSSVSPEDEVSTSGSCDSEIMYSFSTTTSDNVSTTGSSNSLGSQASIGVVNKYLTKHFRWTYSPWRNLFVNEIIRGLNEFASWIWAPTLYGLLFHDLVAYSYPELRYGNTLGKIMGGCSSNEITLSTRLGDDIIGVEYYLLYSLLIASPLIYSIGNCFLHRKWRQTVTSDELDHLVAQMNNDCWPSAINAISRLKWQTWSPSISNGVEMEKRGEQQENSPLQGTFSRQDFWAKIQNLEVRRGPVAIHQMQLLANIALYESRASKIWQEAKAKIEQNASISRTDWLSFIEKFKSNYLLWTIGSIPTSGKRDKIKHLAFAAYFLLKTILFLYALYRFGRLTIGKTIELITYIDNKYVCEHERHLIWSYISEIADYDCSVCGDWSFVYLPDRYTAQGCLNGLLSSQLNEHQIVQRLDRLVRHNLSNGIDHIDLSKKDIARWNQKDFENFLGKFPGNKPFKMFDLGTPKTNSTWPNDTKIDSLAGFIGTHPVESFSLRNQKLDRGFIQKFFQALNHTQSGITLDLSNTRLTDTELELVGETLPNLETRTLILNGCQATEDGWIKFASYLNHNSTLGALHLEKVVLSQRAFDALNDGLASTNIKELVFNGTSLHAHDMTSLSKVLKSLEALSLRSCNIEDEQLILLANEISNSNLKMLDVAYNDITSLSGIVLFRNLNGTELKKINLSNTLLDDQFLSSVKTSLPGTNVTSLVLSNNGFSVSILNDFILNINQYPLELLDLSGTLFNDDNINNLTLVLSRSTGRLRSFVLSHTDITPQGLSNFLQLARANYPMIELDVSYVSLNSSVYKVISEVLQYNSYLQKLNLAGTSMHPKDAQILAGGLNKLKAPLNVVIFDNNKMNDESFGSMANTLITPIPLMSKLGDETISIDQRRALADAKPNTNITFFSVYDNDLGPSSSRKINRILPRTDIAPEDLHINTSELDTDQNDGDNSDTSPASRLRPEIGIDFFRLACSHLLLKGYNTLSYQLSGSNKLLITIDSTPEALAIMSANSQNDFNYSESSAENSSLRIPDLSGVLMLGFFVTAFVQKLLQGLPYNQRHNLTQKDRERLKTCRKALNKARQILQDQSNSYLGRSGIVNDTILYCHNQFNLTTEKIQSALQRSQISEAKLIEIERRIARMYEYIHQHAKQNFTLKRIRAKERYLLREYPDKKFITTVRRRVVSGEIRHELIEIKNNEDQELVSKNPNSYSYQRVLNYFNFWQRGRLIEPNKHQVDSDELSCEQKYNY